MLRKRTAIESVNDFLKNVCDIEHSRHRSITNFLINLVSEKPSIRFPSDMLNGILCLVG